MNEQILMAGIADKCQMDVKMRRAKEVELTIQYQVKIEVSKSWGTKRLWCMVYICGNGVGKTLIGHGGMSEDFSLMVSFCEQFLSREEQMMNSKAQVDEVYQVDLSVRHHTVFVQRALL